MNIKRLLLKKTQKLEVYFVEMLKKFLAYYKPYKKVLFADLFFASLASMAVLAYPLLVNQITKNAINNLDPNKYLYVGQKLTISS